MASDTERVIVLVDMDCFYCQVEENIDPSLAGRPIAVVQYNAWQGGGIIAVNYPARDQGVTRHMRGNEAKKKCPSIELVKVPNVRGKADLTKYREAGKRVAEVLQTFTTLLQRASVDEAYLDITEAVNQKLESNLAKLTIDNLKNTHVVGCETIDFLHNIYNQHLNGDTHLKLAIGGAIVEEVRAAVYEKTGYRCSAGIAHNKILAKLACGMHKPNKQTILPHDGVSELYKSLPLKKIKSLGGKFGLSLSEDLKITYMSELSNFSEGELLKRYDEKTALWLYNIGRGIDIEPVETRLVSNSIGCCKKFPGKSALKTNADVTHWLSELSEEISERLEQDLQENNRRAKQIVVSFAQENKIEKHGSKTLSLNSYDRKKIAKDVFEMLKKFTQKSDGSFFLTFLGLSAKKFEDCKHFNDISSFFKSVSKTDNPLMDAQVTNKPPSSNNLLKYFSINTDNCNIETKEGMINISEIEEDADNFNVDLDATINELRSSSPNSDYLNTTVELDFTEILRNKKEFPHVILDDFQEPLQQNINNIIMENCDSNSSDYMQKSYSDTNGSKISDTSKSFFMNYAKKFETIKLKSFNISKTSDNPINSETAGCSNQESEFTDQVIDCTSDSSNGSTSNGILKEMCTTCNQEVPKYDLISHMDHHMAVTLMEEEKRIFQTNFQANKPKQIIKSPVKQKKGIKNKSVKRKLNSLDNNGSIVAFLTKDSNKDIENMQDCSECGKRIATTEFESHSDYHIAKKMHIALNPVACGKEVKLMNNTSGKVKNCKDANSVNRISSFFNPADQ